MLLGYRLARTAVRMLRSGQESVKIFLQWIQQIDGEGEKRERKQNEGRNVFINEGRETRGEKMDAGMK